MRCFKHALLLLSLVMVGACENKPAAVSTDPGKSVPLPLTDTNPKNVPTPAKPTFAKPTAGTGQAYTLRINEKEGNTWNYTYEVKTFADPRGMTKDNPQWKQVPGYTEANVAGNVTMVVTGVKSGQTTFKKTATVTKSVATGVWKDQAAEVAKNKPDMVIFTWDELMTNINADKGELYDVMTNSLSGLYPKDPVQVGSTWEYRPLPDATENSKAKLEAVEKMDGFNTVRISVQFPGSQPGETNKMLVWIDPTNGRFIKLLMDSVANSNGLKMENHFVQEIKK